MSVQIQDNEKAAHEALRRLYLIGLEASQANRMVEINHLTETRIAAQVTAQSVHDETVRQADADLQTTVGAAKAIYDAAFNPLRETFELRTELCKSECNAAQQAANLAHDEARKVIEAADKLAVAMAEEIYAVELEVIADTDSPEYELVTRKYKASVADAAKARDRALRAADIVRDGLHRAANEQRQLSEQPARAEFDAGYKPIKEAFAPINAPAQQMHGAAKRQAWDTLEASRRAANEAEIRAREDLDLRYNAQRRTRVMLWKRMEEELKRFSSVYE